MISAIVYTVGAYIIVRCLEVRLANESRFSSKRGAVVVRTEELFRIAAVLVALATLAMEGAALDVLR